MWFRNLRMRAAARRELVDLPTTPPAGIADLLENVSRLVRAQVPHAGVPESYRAAVLAWSEIEGGRARCHIDLAASTPHVLVIVDTVAKTRRYVPLVDLVRILGPRVAA